MPHPLFETVIATEITEITKMNNSMVKIFIKRSFGALKQLSPNTHNKPEINK